MDLRSCSGVNLPRRATRTMVARRVKVRSRDRFISNPPVHSGYQLSVLQLISSLVIPAKPLARSVSSGGSGCHHVRRFKFCLRGCRSVVHIAINRTEPGGGHCQWHCRGQHLHRSAQPRRVAPGPRPAGGRLGPGVARAAQWPALALSGHQQPQAARDSGPSGTSGHCTRRRRRRGAGNVRQVGTAGV
jgi:hypothetical protein